MKSGGHYIQGYNCQLSVDSDHQVIVATGVSNQPPDVEHLEPMLQGIGASAGTLPTVMTMDAGYWSEDNVKVCADQGIDVYNRCTEAKGYATGRLPHGPQAQTQEGRQDLRPALAAGFSEEWAIVEPVNGQIKEARGLRRFLLRGLETVNGEWHLIAATHNLLKLFRFRRSQQQALVAASG